MKQNVQTLTEIRQLLEERGLRPKHRLGQNFLHDKNQLIKLLDAAEVKSGDVVLEVGPGTGTLTSALLERGAEVTACELDEDMAAIVEEVFAEHLREPASVKPENEGIRGDTPRLAGDHAPRFARDHTPEPAGRDTSQPASLTLIRGDALHKDRRLNPEIVNAIDHRSFKLVANLPYQIASPLISALLTDYPPPHCVGQFVTIQKEVADRLVATPSTKQYGPLTIIIQALAEVKKIGTLSPSCFWPPPEVTSAMVAIIPKQANEILISQQESPRDFAQFITELFSKRRKQLGTIFGRGDDQIRWPDGVTPDLRPEALTVNQLVQLWRSRGSAMRSA